MKLESSEGILKDQELVGAFMQTGLEAGYLDGPQRICLKKSWRESLMQLIGEAEPPYDYFVGRQRIDSKGGTRVVLLGFDGDHGAFNLQVSRQDKDPVFAIMIMAIQLEQNQAIKPLLVPSHANRRNYEGGRIQLGSWIPHTGTIWPCVKPLNLKEALGELHIPFVRSSVIRAERGTAALWEDIFRYNKTSLPPEVLQAIEEGLRKRQEMTYKNAYFEF